jgi:hypothetical protein
MSAGLRVTGGNGGTKRFPWVSGLSLGATDLFTYPTESFAWSMSRGGLVANDTISFAIAGGESKSCMRFGIIHGAAGVAMASPMQRGR